MVLGMLTGWLDRREREAIAYLIEENRLLRRQLGTRRLRLTDDDRRRLAARAHRVGRGPPGDCHNRNAGHAAAVASPADCAEMDVRSAPRPAPRPSRDPALGRADGGGESDVGLHADPRRAEERGAPRGAIDDSAHPQSGGPSAGTAAADFMADVLERALGQHRRSRFLQKSGPGRVSSRITPSSSLISRPAACRSSDPRRTRRRCSCSRSSGR
jgi:hypothetical protein